MPLLDVDVELAKKVYDVNVFGVIRATQTFSSLVIEAEGTIVIIGSLAGVMPYVFGGPPPSSTLREPQLTTQERTIPQKQQCSPSPTPYAWKCSRSRLKF
jgi:NAD(P)-dependent dehydrogenase (short-subunit alcohol dehydrogenase family)